MGCHVVTHVCCTFLQEVRTKSLTSVALIRRGYHYGQAAKNRSSDGTLSRQQRRFRNKERRQAYTGTMVIPEIENLPLIDVHQEVRHTRDKYVSLWENTPAALPHHLRVYQREEQQENEARLRKIAEERRAHAGGAHAPGDPRHLSGRTFRRLVKLSLACAPSDMKDFFADHEAFVLLTEEFVRRARSFDPDIPEDSLLQALRNIWVFSSLQRLAGKDLRLTPSAFAYSMLYPYTDNVFDESYLTVLEKNRFAERVGLRLKGITPQAAGINEERVFALVGMIEDEFPREAFPLVHQSLEAIHRAQQQSTAQQTRTTRQGKIESDFMLPLTLEKGGTSVLADAFLAGVVADDHWFEVSFSYGCLLQLIDDLQDADVDLQGHSRTLFNITHSSHSLQALTMHLLGFIHSTIEGWSSICSPDQERLKGFMRDSCQVLVLEAVARRSARFSQAFLTQLERHAPTRLTFLASLREQFPQAS